MAEARRIIRPIFSILVIGATALGLLNVLGDNSEVITEAHNVACGDQTCKAQMTRLSRNPFWQEFTFATNIKAQNTVSVTCHRTYYLLGPYQCTRSVK